MYGEVLQVMGLLGNLEDGEDAKQRAKLKRLFHRERGLPPTNKPQKKRLVAEAVIRPRGIFTFEVDYHDGKTKGNLQHLLDYVRKDFEQVRVEETKHGYHVWAPIKESAYNRMERKYLQEFPESDYQPFPSKGNYVSLRISPKIDVSTSKVVSPAPRVVYDTLSEPVRGRLLIYRTSD